jgi:hypothetical protein
MRYLGYKDAQNSSNFQTVQHKYYKSDYLCFYQHISKKEKNSIC